MLKIFSFFLFFIISFKLYAIDTKAEQAVVIDFDTNEVLFEKNSNAKVIPASMTKIMTVYVAFDRIKNTNFAITNECRVSHKAYNCLLYTSPSPRDRQKSRMPSSA